MSAPSLEPSITTTPTISSRMAKYVPPHRRVSPINSSRIFNDPIVVHFRETSPVYSTWLDVKDVYGRDPAVENKFRSRREQQGRELQSCDVSASLLYRDQFNSAIDDVNSQIGGAMLNVGTFLDLGCAPGGFSKWLLQSNQVSRGFGLSLPASDAGLPILMADWNERSRYKFVEANILDDPESFYPLIHEFFSQTRVDLVVCGARHRDAKTLLIDRVSDRESCDYSCNDRLILSQLLIAFRTLAAGGTLVLVTSMKISFRVIDNLVFLREHFAILTPTKGRHLHGTRSSYYLVCQGFVLDETRRTDAVCRIETILRGLSRGTARVSGLSMFEGGQIDLAKKEAEFVINHFTPLWNSQIMALKSDMSRLKSGRGYRARDHYQFKR